MSGYLLLADDELWKLIQEGDKNAFSSIYDSYATEIYRYGLKFTDDGQLIEDVIQDVYIKIWDLRKDICIQSSIKYYLFSAFRRDLIKVINKSHQSQTLDKSQDNLLWESSFQELLIENQISLESNIKLQKAMNSLSHRQKEAIYLRYIEELSYEEISGMMGIQVPSLYNLIFKALKYLKNYLLENKFYFKTSFLIFMEFFLLRVFK